MAWLILWALIFMSFSYQTRKRRWFCCTFFLFFYISFPLTRPPPPPLKEQSCPSHTFILSPGSSLASESKYLWWRIYLLGLSCDLHPGKAKLDCVVFCFSLICTASIKAVYCVSYSLSCYFFICIWKSRRNERKKFLILFGTWTRIFLSLPHSASMFLMQFNH